MPEVQHIGEMAFKLYSIKNYTYARGTIHRTHLKTISMPKVQYIGEQAFAHCEQLSEVRLPASLQDFGKRSFTACDDLNVRFEHTNVESILGLLKIIKDKEVFRHSYVRELILHKQLEQHHSSITEHISKLDNLDFVPTYR